MAGQRWVGSLTIAMVLATAWPAAEDTTQAPAASPQSAARGHDVVTTFLSRRDAPLQSYRARRRLEATNPRYSKEGWVEVMTELGANGFSYNVLAQGGSDYVRRKVLIAALDAERDLAKDAGGGAFDHTNYRFAADGFEGEYPRIRVTPTRKDKLLVDGWLLVSPREADLVAVKGQLSKTPSFWTTRVDVVRRYERINGVRVPIELVSTASVRMAGQSTFKMSYDYESINGVAVVER